MEEIAIDKKEKRRNFSKLIIPIIILTLIIAGIFIFKPFFKPTITGYLTVTEEISYNQTIGEVFTEDKEYSWLLEHPGDLRSIRLGGEISRDGYALVYLEHNNVSYVVFDSDKLKEEGIIGITGFAVANETINGTESIINE